MKLLGVTGCPTGIAHTYMAQEALMEAAKKYGCSIKVETNGAIGVENQLTTNEIEEADAIIVACDKNVNMDRFNGKPVLEVSVSDGINKAEELVQLCIHKKVKIREGTRNHTEDFNKSSIGHQIYKHLMNGVSHMLPLVVAGGVLTAISFLWGIYSFDPNSSQYNEIAATIKQIGGVSMGLMVPVFTAFIAESISGRPAMLAGFVAGLLASETGSGFIGGIAGGFFTGYLVYYLVKVLKGLPRELEGLKSIFIIPIISVFLSGLFMILLGGPCASLNQAMMNFLSGLQNSNPLILGIVVGSMSAFDMGGPVNKAAYVTGTLLLGEGNYLFMAGVSAACITPPLIIAIAATIAKNRFTKDDRIAGYINYILGFTHITEGAIPFAAKNPLKVIPILMIGSSISAVLSYMNQIEVPAPHGGFLILGLVNKPLMWVLCILAGSIVGAILYILVTPKVQEEQTQTIANHSLFAEKTVVLNVNATTKEGVIDEMIHCLVNDGVINDQKAFKKEILDREAIASTAVGMGIAIPHARTQSVNFPRVAVGISKVGFDYNAPDEKKCHLLFMIATCKEDGDLHLKTLANLSKQLMHEGFVKQLLNATSEKEIVQLLESEGL